MTNWVRQCPTCAGFWKLSFMWTRSSGPARSTNRCSGLNSIYRDTRLCAYDVGGRGVLLLFLRGHSLQTVHLPGGTIPPHDGSGPVHIAFSIAADELAAWEARLAEAGIAIEGRTTWSRGGTSIYFRDPDDHLLELATPGLWPGY